jgi:pyruvate kinase
VFISYTNIARQVQPGQVIFVDDGNVELRVVEVDKAAGTLIVESMTSLALGERKNVNLPGLVVDLPAVTAKDEVDLATARELGADFIFASFVQSADAVRQIRKLCGPDMRIISKIESQEGIDNIDEILRASDGIMVARGDLAVEVGDASVPALQKRMIRMAREMNKLTITATQMMESMISSPVPTRAEVSDVANAVLDGTDAVMLSAETAAGNYPLETVREMAQICVAAEAGESVKLETDFVGKTFAHIDQSIAMGALFTAHHLGAKAIVAMTDSGSTALWMSRHLIQVPIYALTPNVASQRRMTLYRNVRPLLMSSSKDRDTALSDAEAQLKKLGIVSSGDVYAITCGEPMGAPGGTNMMKVCRVS